ncbi:MAG: lysophospholipid acyltransferase family protein [Actinomycetota bacterium]
MADRRSPAQRKALQQAQRAAGAAEELVSRATAPIRRRGFPYRAPTVPFGVTVPEEASGLGAHYDTSWARDPLPTVLRGAIVEGPMRLAARVLTDPETVGGDRLADLQRLEDPPPLIFTANHHSHLDTGLMIRSIPIQWRHKLVVAAAADYFFDARWKATLSALALNAIPIDRESTGRRSADLTREMLEDGYSLVIYPEGGRSPDGWGQDWKGGAAYLSGRTGVPVVPVFIDGTGAIFGKGMKRPKRGRTQVVFGAPITPAEGESTRRFAARIHDAVATLGDEALTDFWTAKQRAATGATPTLTGPEYTGWRRDWALADRRRRGRAGRRRVSGARRWPEL